MTTNAGGMIEILTPATMLTAMLATQAEMPLEPTPETEVALAAAEFMDAISSDDKTALADHMIPEAVIFVHNRLDPENPRVDVVPVSEHLERWALRTPDYEERMRYDSVMVDGDMAQVWGRYSFTMNGTLTHCGVNSLSMVRTDDGWKIGNTSFSMIPPAECEAMGAPMPEPQEMPL